jgi:parvulin-like peptidyl-prolyl isomerase
MPHGRNLKLILLFSFLCYLSACHQQGQMPSSVLLRVNGRTTTLDQFQREFSRLLASERTISEQRRKELERSYLAQKIDREIILGEADRADVRIPAERLEAVVAENIAEYPDGDFERMLEEQHLAVKEWRGQLEDNLLIEAAVSRLAYDRIQVGEEEIATYYQENRTRFHRPEQVRARQITVATEAEGRRVLGLLQQGMAFAEAAEKHSRSPDAEQGGDLGFFGRGEMPAEFDQAVFTLPAGRQSELVKSEYGFHIFLVEEKRPASRLTLEQVHDEIAADLREAKEEQAYQEWLQTLRSQATIEVDWTLL